MSQTRRPHNLRELIDSGWKSRTVKQEMRDNSPFGLFAVSMKDVVRVHSSSGTTGSATVVGYTRGDLDLWATLIARSLASAGGSCDDILQVAYGYGLFTGGLGMHYGAEKLGAAALPKGAILRSPPRILPWRWGRP